jgi:PRTRC genetic system protein B
MKDITNDFGTLYYPVSALVFYKEHHNKDTYVEHFDMDSNGNPVNAHPLTVREANQLAQSLSTEQEKNKAFLKSQSILSTHILRVNPSKSGSVLWYTQAQQRQLFFAETLGIPSGTAAVPAMLWFASKQSLFVFALGSNRRPTEKTKLYHAPFFNIYDNGNVCMGTVNVQIKNTASLEAFTASWDGYFWGSYFSHLMSGHNPINGNCVTLWKDLIQTGRHFPEDALKATNKTLKNLLQ